MTIDLSAQALEKEKYNKIWELDKYRRVAPGEQFLIPWLQVANPNKGSSIRDYGTGTGRAALFMRLSGMKVEMVDIADNCLDEHVQLALGDHLTIACLWDLPYDMPVTDYGYCTDVMEHIPPDHVDDVLENIFRTCKECFFNISFHIDHFGQEIDDVLHLTVKPFVWWRDKLKNYGELVDARDLLFHGIFYVRGKQNGS